MGKSVTVYIDKDERWPEFIVSDQEDSFYGDKVVISEELLNRHKAALAEFDAVQAQLGRILKSTMG